MQPRAALKRLADRLRLLVSLDPGLANRSAVDPDLSTPRSDAGHIRFHRFADVLPYSAYDAETRLFLIEADRRGVPEGWGFTLELRPQIGATREMAEYLVNLFAGSIPEGSGIQVQMFGSPHLDALFQGMRETIVPPEQLQNADQAQLLERMNSARISYYAKGSSDQLWDNFNTRMRTYRTNLSVVIPATSLDDPAPKQQAIQYRQQVIEVLKQYYLFGFEWSPQHLIDFVSLLLNPHRTFEADYSSATYDPTREIRYQIIAPDTQADERENEILYGGTTQAAVAVRAMSVRNYPSTIGLYAMGELLGSATSSSIAYPCPFLLTTGVLIPNYDKEKNRVTVKAARAQQMADSAMARFIPNLQAVNADWKIAQLAFTESGGICKLYHEMLLFCRPEELARVEKAAAAVWRAQRFEIVTDRKMQKLGVLASLPMLFGSLLQKDMALAQRLSTKTKFNAANMLPIIAEWTEHRRGQERAGHARS